MRYADFYNIDNLKDIVSDDKIMLEIVPAIKKEKIKRISLSYQNLEYLQLADYEKNIILIFKTNEIKKYELKNMNEMLEIFFYIDTEYKFSLFSKELTLNEYKIIIEKLKEYIKSITLKRNILDAVKQLLMCNKGKIQEKLNEVKLKISLFFPEEKRVENENKSPNVIFEEIKKMKILNEVEFFYKMYNLVERISKDHKLYDKKYFNFFKEILTENLFNNKDIILTQLYDIEDNILIEYLKLFFFISRPIEFITEEMICELNETRKYLEKNFLKKIEGEEIFKHTFFFSFKVKILLINFFEKVYYFYLKNNKSKKIEKIIQEVLRKKDLSVETVFSYIEGEYLNKIQEQKKNFKNNFRYEKKKIDFNFFDCLFDEKSVEVITRITKSKTENNKVELKVENYSEKRILMEKEEKFKRFCFSNIFRISLYYKVKLINILGKINYELKKEENGVDSDIYLKLGMTKNHYISIFNGTRNLGTVSERKIINYLLNKNKDPFDSLLKELFHNLNMLKLYNSNFINLNLNAKEGEEIYPLMSNEEITFKIDSYIFGKRIICAKIYNECNNLKEGKYYAVKIDPSMYILKFLKKLENREEYFFVSDCDDTYIINDIKNIFDIKEIFLEKNDSLEGKRVSFNL